MVLATRGDRELFGRKTIRYAIELPHNTLSEMGMVVISSTLTVGPIDQTLSGANEPIGEAGASLERAFQRFADDLVWWAEAAKTQRAKRVPPY